MATGNVSPDGIKGSLEFVREEATQFRGIGKATKKPKRGEILTIEHLRAAIRILKDNDIKR